MINPLLNELLVLFLHRKERKVFETYHKELRTTRDKKEKEELEALREEVYSIVDCVSSICCSPL